MWYDDVIAVHTAVTDNVSHIQRMKSRRYFVWEEEDRTDLIADNKHEEQAISIVTDLFTNIEFDPWVEELCDSLQQAGYSWRYEFVDYEVDTKLYHHQWRWVYYG